VGSVWVGERTRFGVPVISCHCQSRQCVLCELYDVREGERGMNTRFQKRHNVI
jgi:hypothetical protein